MTIPFLRPAAAVAALAFAAPASAAPAMPRTDASEHALAGKILDASEGRFLPGPAALSAALAEADVALLGEVHDNPEHHAAQAWLVSAIGPAGLAFEMIRPGDESALGRLRAAGASNEEFDAALEWSTRGWPDFPLYAPILAAAPEAVVTGAEVAPDLLAKSIGEGASAAALEAFGAAGARYGLDTPLAPEAEAALTAEQVAAHCDAIPQDVARGMVQAQRLRDAAIADASLRAFAMSGQGAVAVVAGAGHTRRDAAPAVLAVARPDLDVLSLAFVETREGREDWRDYLSANEPGWDYVWFTAPETREDLCVAFRAAREPEED